MHGAVIAEVLGQLIPLAAGAEAEDDPVEGGAPIDAFAAAMALRRRRCVRFEDRLDEFPEFVGDFPEGVQGLDVTLRPWQGCVS
jgi:hypothetical protein